MKYRRVIVFGCSWTRYYWPTFANVISDMLNIPLINKGRPGIGNIAILHKMLDFDIDIGFNDDDLILVNWSSWGREDRIGEDSKWKAGGNVIDSKFYGPAFAKQYQSAENDFIRNAGAIIMANRMFNITYQSSMNDINEEHLALFGMLTQRHSEHITEYSKWIKNMPSEIELFHLIKPRNTDWHLILNDGHPSVYEHLLHAQKIAKHIGFEDIKSVSDLYNELYHKIVSKLKLVKTKKLQKDPDKKILWTIVLQSLKELGMPQNFQGHRQYVTGKWND